MLEIISITQIEKYQVIRLKENPKKDFKQIKIGNDVFDPIVAFDMPNCIAIESSKDYSQIKEIELLY